MHFSKKKLNLLVLGGTGFIGSHVVSRATQKKWKVTSVSFHGRNNSKYIKGVTYLKIDLTKYELLKKIKFSEFDYVINLSGYIDHSPFFQGGRKNIENHFDIVLNIIEKCGANIKCFLQVGSSDEYGDLKSPLSEEQREKPISPYSLGKVATSHFLQMLHNTESFPCTILRIFLTYGPGQDKKRFIPQIIDGCLSNNSFPTSLGEQLRDFCYIDDVVDAIFLCLENQRSHGQIYNVGSGEPIQIKTMIEKIVRLIGKGTPNFGTVPYRKGESMELYPDTSKIKKDLGWEPKYSLDEGLKKSIEWYKNDANQSKN